MDRHSQRSVRARSAWLLAITGAMFAALISLPTSAAAQPRSNIAPCERVLFPAFYAASVEGVPQSGLTACLSGTIQPTNRVFTSWTDAPRLLRHLKHIDDRRLAQGVRRTDLPSPGEVALANYGALIARCELVEETPDAGLDVDASADAEADAGASPRRSRVQLSQSAMRRYAWDPFAWFPGRCARRLSIEIRPAEAVMVSHVVRSDAFVADATRRLADPAIPLSSIPPLVSGLRDRLAAASATDPVPVALFPSLVSALLRMFNALPPACFIAAPDESAAPVADTSVTGELARLRDENGRLTRENGALRASNEELPRTLARWLGALALLALLAFVVGALIKRARAAPKVDQGVEGEDSSSLTILPPAPAMDEAAKSLYKEELHGQWEKENRRHFDTMITRHRGELAEEVGKRRTVEEERDRYRTAFLLLQEASDVPELAFSDEREDDALVPSVEGSGAPLSSTAISNDLWEPAPIKPTDAATKLLRRLAEFASDYIVGDDPRREILSSPEHAATAEEVDACSQAAFDVITQWRRQIEAFDQPLGSDPDHRDTLSMLEHASPEAAANPNGAGPSKHDTLPGGFPAVVIPASAEPK